MPVQNAPIDFIAYDTDGSVVLLAEAKSRRGTSEAWAAKLRRNMLAHGVLPRAKYFLIATPERIYGWAQESLTADDAPPQFTVDAHEALGPYFKRTDLDPADVSPGAFDLLVLAWLTDISRADQLAEIDPSLKCLSESGLLSSLQHAEIEMNSER